MSKAFKLGSILNEQTLSQAKNSHKVVYLDINSIVPNPENDKIYNEETDSVDFLSYSIEDKGLLQPLVVKKLKSDNDSDSDTYEVISGHRRRKAILKIIERNSPKAKDFSYVPCIIRANDKGAADGDDYDVKETLVDGNLFNRQKTSAEISKEIAVKKEILEIRKKNGEKIAGKILSLIAEDMGISDHQAKKFNAINKNASDEVKEAFEKGEISTETAYELSKADENTQKEILEKSKETDSPITTKDVKDELNKKKTANESSEKKTTEFDNTTENNEKHSEDTPSNIITPLPNEENDDEKETDNPRFEKRLNIITQLVNLIKLFDSSSEKIELEESEIKEVQAALELVYNYIMSND